VAYLNLEGGSLGLDESGTRTVCPECPADLRHSATLTQEQLPVVVRPHGLHRTRWRVSKQARKKKKKSEEGPASSQGTHQKQDMAEVLQSSLPGQVENGELRHDSV
jgi:hypothetical protein